MAQATMLSQYEQDPRPDLESDHGWWVALLTAAKTYNEEIFGILHCLRCGGAGLQRSTLSGLRIVPGQWELDSYAEFRDKYLRPNTQAIKNLLAKAAKANIKYPTTKEEVVARVKALEPKLLSAGWTHSEIWSTEPWLDDRGMERQSVYAYLLTSPAAEVGEVTGQHVEFRYRVNGQVWPKLLVRSGAVTALFADAPEAPQESATMKKEAV